MARGFGAVVSFESGGASSHEYVGESGWSNQPTLASGDHVSPATALVRRSKGGTYELQLGELLLGGPGLCGSSTLCASVGSRCAATGATAGSELLMCETSVLFAGTLSSDEDTTSWSGAGQHCVPLE